MVTGFGLLFRPSPDHTPFRIKEKPYNHRNMKWEEISPLHIYIDKTITIL